MHVAIGDRVETDDGRVGELRLFTAVDDTVRALVHFSPTDAPAYDQYNDVARLSQVRQRELF